jgi:hypothetical protein
MNDAAPEIFEPSQEFPDPDAQRRLAGLIGIESHRERLEKGLRLILDPQAIEAWSERHHRRRLAAIDHFRSRPPLFILAGDVGVGKTALAEIIGDAVARAEKIGVTLFRLSLASRGTGLQGQTRPCSAPRSPRSPTRPRRPRRGRAKPVLAASCSSTRPMRWHNRAKRRRCTMRTAQASTRWSAASMILPCASSRPL